MPAIGDRSHARSLRRTPPIQQAVFLTMPLRELRRAQPNISLAWVVRIAGKHMYLWRAVDHEGEVLEILVQRRRDRSAAIKLMRKLLRKQGFAPTRVTTDKRIKPRGTRTRWHRISSPSTKSAGATKSRAGLISTASSTRSFATPRLGSWPSAPTSSIVPDRAS
jgi:hypothetical protein